MNANAIFEASFQQAVIAGMLLYALCIGALALLGASAAVLGRRRFGRRA